MFIGSLNFGTFFVAFDLCPLFVSMSVCKCVGFFLLLLLSINIQYHALNLIIFAQMFSFAFSRFDLVLDVQVIRRFKMMSCQWNNTIVACIIELCLYGGYRISWVSVMSFDGFSICVLFISLCFLNFLSVSLFVH